MHSYLEPSFTYWYVLSLLQWLGLTIMCGPFVNVNNMGIFADWNDI